MPRVSLDFSKMEGKHTLIRDFCFILKYIYIYFIYDVARFKELNSVEARSFKATLNEKDGLAKVAMRDLPSTSSNEKIQTDLKQKAKEILMKDVQLQSKILSKKSRKVLQKEKTKSNALVNTVSFKSLRK